MTEKTIYSKLIEFRKNLPEIDLDCTVTVETKSGGTFSYKYSSMKELISKLTPALSEHDLGFRQAITEKGVKTFIFDSKEEIVGSFFRLTFDGTMQDQGTKITYARRYSLSAAFGISAETDNDAQDADNKSNDTTKKKKYQDDNKPWLNFGTEEYKKALAAVKSGQVNPKDARAKYKVNKKVMKALEDAYNNSDIVEDALEAGL